MDYIRFIWPRGIFVFTTSTHKHTCKTAYWHSIKGNECHTCALTAVSARQIVQVPEKRQKLQQALLSASVLQNSAAGANLQLRNLVTSGFTFLRQAVGRPEESFPLMIIALDLYNTNALWKHTRGVTTSVLITTQNTRDSNLIQVYFTCLTTPVEVCLVETKVESSRKFASILLIVLKCQGRTSCDLKKCKTKRLFIWLLIGSTTEWSRWAAHANTHAQLNSVLMIRSGSYRPWSGLRPPW